MKIRAAVLLVVLGLAGTGCHDGAESPVGADRVTPEFAVGGGFGSGTRSDTTTSPPTASTDNGGATVAGDSTTGRTGGGFGSGT